MANYTKDLRNFDTDSLTLINNQRKRIAEKLNEYAQKSMVETDEGAFALLYCRMCALVKLATDVCILDYNEGVKLQSIVDDFFNGVPTPAITIREVSEHVHGSGNCQSLIMIEKIYIQENVGEMMGAELEADDSIDYVAESLQVYAEEALGMSILDEKEFKTVCEAISQYKENPSHTYRVDLIPRDFYNRIY